ncbi:MAG TPA: 30S ribosomal protein S13 [Candidatus Aenigmarchaeota archaeon]|nr:30S ribosomal protein S13 [Candidatus Aenigmarchaeota archaeon]
MKKKEVKGIVRIAGTDIDGNRPIYMGLTDIKGISFMFSNAICKVLGLDPKMKIGNLSESDVKKIENVLNNPLKYGIPEWLCNRRKDIETGETKQLVSSELEFRVKEDIKRLINIKAYRGVRHMYGLKVRGQRTRSTGRKGRTVGVVRKKVLKEKGKEGKSKKK